MSSLKIVGSGLIRTICLNDGVEMPLFGLGCYLLETERTVSATEFSLKHGYRLIDTATMYKNEQQVGEGIKQSGIKREDIFVVTKVSPFAKNHGYDAVIKGVKASLEKLGTGYIDLMLIHSPRAGKLLDTYDGLLKMKEEGLIKSVGVSNFGVHHLEEMRKAGKPTPSVNQIELNCFWRQDEIVKYCHEHDIAVMGYSPIFRNKKKDHPTLVEMAKRYNKSVPQLMIRWSVQKDYITIPKSSNHERIAENAQIFDFAISDEDIKILDDLPPERCCFVGSQDPTESSWIG